MAWTAALFSALHVIGVAIGLSSIYARARACLREDIVAAEVADNWWGVSALLLIGTGLYRALGGLDKPWAFYVVVKTFHLKMGLLGLVLVLELWPMITLLAWRIRKARTGEDAPPTHLRTFGYLSAVQTCLLVFIVFSAAMMSRGLSPF